MEPVLPPPPEETILDFYKVARRWKSASVVVESQLERAGIEFVPVPQKPKKGVRLSDLLAFEQRWRQAEIDRAERRKQDAQRHAEARKRLHEKQKEADGIVAKAQGGEEK